ncbi:MAG: IS66 family transposase [Burkholderiales bacterium]
MERRIAELERQLAAALARIAEQDPRIAELQKLLEQRTRDGKRQAAPFSKGAPKETSKKPGRKPGPDYGTQAFRTLPEGRPDQILRVKAPRRCPSCGGNVRETHVAQQFQIEIPRRAILRRFDLHIGECTCCGKRVQPRHELQTSDALGAAAVQIGPDAQALMALLKNKLGLSYGDITALMKDAWGIEVTRGAAAHIVRRAGERAESMYDAFKAMIPQRDTVYPDETGWKINGRLHWLWDFVTDLFTVYVIRPSRGVDVPGEVLGMEYAGRMTHDGWAPYDKFLHAVHQQCLQHLLRRAKELIEQLGAGTSRFARRVRDFILDALGLRDRRREGRISDSGYAIARGRLEKRLDRLLSARPKAKACRTFRNHLDKHRDQLLTFLYEENLEATNWPAEQAIRPAVVNRKVFGGNRTATGAHALEVLASLFATCRQNAIDALTLLSNLLRGAPSLHPATL